MSNRRLLIAFAYPDDESFGLGGLISRYVAEGVDVYLICATNGDVGTVPPEMLNGYRSISELRLAELDCASEKLGFREVFKFGYKDSGMLGSETNNDPACLWYNWQHGPEEVTRRVVQVIREIKPHVIITFNKYGGYGHPDHIAIQGATTEAFDLAAAPNYIVDGLPPYRPQKLYYNSIPSLTLRLGILMTRLRGKDPRKLGRNNDIDLVAIIDHIEPTHIKIDIADYLDAWAEASACHASQGGGTAGLIPLWVRKAFGKKQGLTRVFPSPKHGRVDEYDLFTGIHLEQPAAETVQ